VTNSNSDELRAIGLLRQLIDQLAVSGELPTALNALLQAAASLAWGQHATVHLQAPGHPSHLEVAAKTGFDSITLESLNALLSGETGPAHRAAQARAPVSIDDYSNESSSTESILAARLGFFAAQSVPLLDDASAVIAVVTIYFDRPHHSTQRELEWIELFAKQVRHLLRQARAREDLEASEERFRSIFQESNDFIVTADLQQRISYCNPATAAALGWPSEQIIGRSIAEFIPAPHFDRTSAMLDQKLRAGGSTRYEVEVATRDGRRMTWEINSRLTFGPDGKPTGLHAIGRDVTSMRQAHEALRISERALREADQRKNEFLAMLAHELRNPLAPIRTAAQILKKSRGSPDQIEQASEIVERQVEHITRIVDDLLDVSRVTRGLVTLDMQPTSLRDVLLTAVEQVRPMIDSKQHRLNVTLPDHQVILSGEGVRLVQMVSNLLSNAARHSGTNGMIDLFVVVHLQLVEIHVRDHGFGIAPALLPRIFDLFAQGDRSAARSEGGLGIGLALVRRLAELHGGHVEATSAGLGRGAEFTIVLPRLADDTIRSSATTPIKATENDPLRILIVDDNRDAANMLAVLLQLDGHQTFVEYDAHSALQRAQAERPEVMLLDIGLPDMNGYELAQQLRSTPATAGAWLVAVTGYGQEDDRKQSKAAGFDHHLMKPVGADELKVLLAELKRAS
jgi:PAS domain S-box-containing protein